MQIEKVPKWVTDLITKIFPAVKAVIEIVDLVREYGPTVYNYASDYFAEVEISNMCSDFYDYVDYMNDETDDDHWWSYFDDFEEMSDEEYYGLRDFCGKKRPRDEP